VVTPFPSAGITQSRFQGSMGAKVEPILSAEASAPPTAVWPVQSGMLRHVTGAVNALQFRTAVNDAVDKCGRLTRGHLRPVIVGLSRVLKKRFSCFDRLSTNGK